MDFLSACINGDIMTVKNVLDGGGEIEAKNIDGWTPLITPRGSTALKAAASEGHVLPAKVLLDARASIDVPGNDGYTSLHATIFYGHISMVRLLVKHGANIEMKTSNGTTALGIACERSEVDIARVLLKSGAQVNTFNTDGCSPLIMATSQGNTAILDFLSRTIPISTLRVPKGQQHCELLVNMATWKLYENSLQLDPC
ncbi:unnamed protein product [Phytophthora lilii]|uniref:Unnamed protein product n=1 Tax=Phytophthora lilii TaxID=2077276 RepID=A0A9W6YK67_9STRA|nr:unnamed protein product [Phytophthora lilii]